VTQKNHQTTSKRHQTNFWKTLGDCKKNKVQTKKIKFDKNAFKKIITTMDT
jgi:hypothetical protein